MTEWLRERGVEEDELAEVISRLIESGGLDDERFAQRFAEDKREIAGWGPDRIGAALRARGVEDGLIETAIAAEDTETQIDRALALLESRGVTAESEPERARALALLARRGFPGELAYEAIRRRERRAA